MNACAFTESVVEQVALAWLESVGWQVRHGAEVALREPAAGCDDRGKVVLAQRLRKSVRAGQPGGAAEALAEAFRKLTTS